MDAALRRASDRDLVVVCEAGDRMAPEALFEIARVAGRDPLVDLVYWDDDAPRARTEGPSLGFGPPGHPTSCSGPATSIGRSPSEPAP